MKELKNVKKIKEENCFTCDSCIYIGEGDYICESTEEPIIVITNHHPYKYFNCCKEKNYFNKPKY